MNKLTENNFWKNKINDLLNETKGDKAKTITKIQEYIKNNYSFSIGDDAEGTVYYGTIGKGTDEIHAWEIVKEYVNSSKGIRGYISSTEAGELFNEDNFNDALPEALIKNNEGDIDINLYNGQNSDGKIHFKNGSIVQAFNDFFSENYIKNLKCSNVSTVFFGAPVTKDGGLNCFARTEFKAILDNSSIKTINNVDKEVFREIFYNAPKGQEMSFVTEALKAAQIDNLAKLPVYKTKNGDVNILDACIINGDTGDTSKLSDFVKNNSSRLSDKGKKSLYESISNNEKALKNYSKTNSSRILKLADESETLYFDKEGKLTGRSYKDTVLANYLEDNVPEIYAFKAKASEFEGFHFDEHASDADMVKNYGKGFEKASIEDKIKLKEIDYRCRTDGSFKGIPKEQTRNAIKYSDDLGVDAIRRRLLEALDKIPENNKDKNMLLKNVITGKTPIVGLDDDVSAAINARNGARLGARIGAVLGVLDLVGDVSDLYGAGTVFQQAYKQYKNGDIETASDTLGSWGMSTLGGIAGGAAVGDLAGMGIGALVAAGLVSGPIGWAAVAAAGIVGGIMGSDFGELIWDKLLDSLTDDYSDAGSAQPPRDPLAVDLGAMGIDLTTLDHGVNFDLDKNGFAEKTAWIGKEDGFLVFDRNGNGRIDDGGELFGDQVELSDGNTSKSGFEALADLDSNKDGVLDEKDKVWNKLQIWTDADQNGISGDNELRSLNDSGIKSISLETTKEENVDTASGSMEAEYSAVTLTDGTQRKISEFWFPVNTADTTTGDDDHVGTIGNVPDIYTAISKDKTGTLSELYDRFRLSEDYVEKRYLLKKILYFITDSASIDPDSRGGNIDARDLHVIETFMGHEFSGVGGKDPNSNAAKILKDMYSTIENTYFNDLNADSIYGAYINTVFVNKDKDGKNKLDMSLLNLIIDSEIKDGKDVSGLIYNAASYFRIYDEVSGNTNAFEEFSSHYSEDYADIIETAKSGLTYLGSEASDSYSGTSDNDFVFGEEENDYLHGGSGYDAVNGGMGNDILYGDSGNDILNGDDGSDTLDGGSGSDTLKGGAGSDTYIFAEGYGHDTVIDSDGLNTLRFKGLSSNDILVNGTGDSDVTVTIKGTNDSLVLKNFRKDDEFKNYYLEFDDAEMSADDKNSPFRYIYGGNDSDTLKAAIEDSVMHAFGGDDRVYGSKGNDIIYGNDGNDYVYSGNGNDYIYAGDGSDTVDGGEGNDFLYGGSGGDTYIFGKNYGTDIINDTDGVSTIRLLNGISSEDLTISAVGEDAVIGIKGTKDKLIVSDYASNPENYVLQIGNEQVSLQDKITTEEKEFTSGSDNYDYIVNEDKKAIAGGASGDRIIGSDNAEYIFGDSGDDQLLAGGGSDVIFGGSGSGYINGGNGQDVIDPGSGSNFIDGGSGNDIYIVNPYSGHNTIKDSDGANTIMFGDGFKADAIKAYRSNWNDLLIRFDGLEDTLTIKNYCIDENARNFRLVFADGTVVNAADKSSPLRSIYGTDNSDYMPSIYKDGITIAGDDGNDQLVGSDGDDSLYGNKGNDRLTGNGGNDILDGGADNDFLYGGHGDDTYIFRKGYGTDTIGDGEGANTIEIKGYSASQIKAYRTNWNDITLTFEGSDDKLVIEGFFTDEQKRNFYLKFDNGSRIHAVSSGSPLRTIYGTENGDYITAMDDRGVTIIGVNGSDNLNGGNGSDRLIGGMDDDQLYGNGGDDVLNGGEGRDFLYGGNGNDTYIFETGYGSDTIIDSEGVNTIFFGSGITAEKLTAYRTDWNNLTVKFADSDDSLVIKDYFTSENSRNFNVDFEDGTEFAYDDARNPIKDVHASEYDDWMSAWSDNGIVLHGGGGNDHLTGGKGDDTLTGDVGEDYLAGGEGSDTYIFGNGFGSDIVEDNDGENRILLQKLNVDDVTFSSNHGELDVKINNSDDVLTIKNYDPEKFTFEFADDVKGTVNSSGEFLKSDSEENIIQNNADALSDMYFDDTLSTDVQDNYTDTVIPEIADTSAIVNKNDQISVQTDIQAMVLAENVAGFADENKVSEGIKFSEADENVNALDQLLVNSRAS